MKRRTSSGPEKWDFGDRDDLVIPIDDAIPVDIVQRTDGDEARVQTSHLATIDVELRWFTDCGKPV